MTKVAKTKPGTKERPVRAPAQATAKVTAKSFAVKSDDEKRLARNAALRTWRKKNKKRVARYMAEWRSRRSGKPQPTRPGPVTATPIAAVPNPSLKKTNPSKTTKKSKAKKGGKA